MAVSFELIGHTTTFFSASTSDGNCKEVIVALASDSAFFQMLHKALATLSAHLQAVKADFMVQISQLAAAISRTARPASEVAGSGFKPLSQLSGSSNLTFSSTFRHKSDLSAWREIFQIYVDSEIFESLNERDHGVRSVEEAEKRLSAFASRVTQNGLGDGRTLRMKESRAALETFLQLNVLILNLLKVRLSLRSRIRKGYIC
jgi:hypothetical protein